jgi:outer membrane protein OmpA-like peptidoglycan-associated protein
MNDNDDLNYWPSFVDLMSSMFIIVLTIFFVLFLSQQYLSYLISKGEEDLSTLKRNLEKKETTGVQVTNDGRITIGDNILFLHDVSDLSPHGEKVIFEIGKELKDFLNDERRRKFSIVVEGHTDTKGAAEYNKTLSFKRAKEVTDFWEKELSFGSGIDLDYDIFPAGYGESKLKVLTADEVGNEINRRVEIRVVPKFDEMLSEILRENK